ncbi:MAG: hypothetical protein ACLFQ5_02635 [Oceanicaulis sp.]
MLRHAIIAALGALVLSACSYSTQTSSGADYLAGYRGPAAAAGAAAREQAKAEASLDEEIRAIAAIEPALRFPARIGVARVENRQLTSVPPSELAYWGELAERLGRLGRAEHLADHGDGGAGGRTPRHAGRPDRRYSPRRGAPAPRLRAGL